MSTNAVLCVTDGKHTARLTKYRCKPTLLLNQLAHVLAGAPELSVGQVVGMLTNNGFDQEAEFSSPFLPACMQPGLIVNWAWSLDLDDMSLKYWDVTMPTASIADMVTGPATSPLEHLHWVGEDGRAELRDHFFAAASALNDLGIVISGFEQSIFYADPVAQSSSNNLTDRI